MAYFETFRGHKLLRIKQFRIFRAKVCEICESFCPRKFVRLKYPKFNRKHFVPIIFGAYILLSIFFILDVEILLSESSQQELVKYLYVRTVAVVTVLQDVGEVICHNATSSHTSSIDMRKKARTCLRLSSYDNKVLCECLISQQQMQPQL